METKTIQINRFAVLHAEIHVLQMYHFAIRLCFFSLFVRMRLHALVGYQQSAAFCAWDILTPRSPWNSSDRDALHRQFVLHFAAVVCSEGRPAPPSREPVPLGSLTSSTNSFFLSSSSSRGVPRPSWHILRIKMQSMYGKKKKLRIIMYRLRKRFRSTYTRQRNLRLHASAERPACNFL